MSKTSDAGSATHFEFTTLMQISHYYALRSAARNIKALDNIATNISVSLLRHTDIIPADKGFYEAGVDTKVGMSTQQVANEITQFFTRHTLFVTVECFHD